MKILVYGLNYAPELTGIGKYTGEMCSWLAAEGHEVRVVTTPPYYPAWKVGKGYSGWRYRTEFIEGVKVVRCPLWVPEKPTGLKRMIHLFSYALSSFPIAVKEAIFWRPEVVFTVEPAIFSVPGAWAAARLSGANAWLHIQDFELDAAFDLGIVKSGGIKNIVMALEKFLMKRFDTVSTISPRMFDKLTAKGVVPEKRFLFPNWVDKDSVYPLPHKSPMRKELGIPDDKTVLLYSGNMGEKQGLEILLDAAEALANNKDILFILCGDGAVRKRLVERANGLDNVMFMDLQPLEKLNDLLNMADIHLLPQRADVEDLVMPSKLLGIFSSGRPVIATAHKGTQIANVVEDRGMVVKPGDAKAFTEAVLTLVKDQAKRKSYGASARKYCVENWGRDEVLTRFEEKAFTGKALKIKPTEVKQKKKAIL